MSLLYECINTVIAVLISISSGMPNHTASIQLCVQKLRILIEDTDQNCKVSIESLTGPRPNFNQFSFLHIFSEIFRIIGDVKDFENTSEKRSSS